ncbi:histidinol-phosphatase HisJ [Candidatus Gottesmanbacteria bacterium]|nr:histidinol-phosphatase HisJ [Candidatus Gottesmanbacteria bacterium]
MKKIFLFDYHVQALAHERGSKLRIEETIESAIEKGLSAICLTDHFPLPSDFTDLTKDVRVKYPGYVDKVISAKEKYKNDIEVLLGAEFDWLSSYEEWIENAEKQYPFDYVIGSVHFLDNIPIDYTKEYFVKAIKTYGGIKSLITKYYENVRKVSISNLFDSIGHLDRIKVFNDGNFFSEKVDWYRMEVLKTLDVIAKYTKTIEVNTAGLNRVCQSTYPSLWILKEAKKRGINLTLGSDAHFPQKVGRNLDIAVSLAKQAGFTSLVRFKNRTKIEVKI